MFYPLNCAGICIERTLGMIFLGAVVYRPCKYRNQKARLAEIVQDEK